MRLGSDAALRGAARTEALGCMQGRRAASALGMRCRGEEKPDAHRGASERPQRPCRCLGLLTHAGAAERPVLRLLGGHGHAASAQRSRLTRL